ncbi:uncharacterized protein LOC135495006 isoform X3 [Lineus longissimus]|uniref:uncharacterized protein LOC135495006 isoform X3 n=1 Tax=Lineus longissimus TaxID=88925 RepID=UPI00315CB291
MQRKLKKQTERRKKARPLSEIRLDPRNLSSTGCEWDAVFLAMGQSTDDSQSTYDNPSFQYDDFSHGPPTSRYKYQDEEPASITFKEGGEKKTCCCYALFILLIILIYAGVVVGVCIYFLVILPEQRASMKPIEHYTKIFSCQVRVVEGPFSQHNIMLNEPLSSQYQTFAGAWQFQMDQTFKDSSLGSNYDSTKVTSFGKGSLIINFDINLKKEIGAKESVYDDIKRIILSSCKVDKEKSTQSLCISGGFLFSRNDINVTSTDGKKPEATTTPPEPPSPDCVLIPNNTHFGCHTFYTHAIFPNFINQTNMKEAKAALLSNDILITTDCYWHTKLFLCSLLMPKCVNRTVNITTTAMPTTTGNTAPPTTAGATTQPAGGSHGGSTQPVGATTQTAGGSTQPAANSIQPSAGGTTHPVGGTTQSIQPSAGGTTQPVGGTTQPEGHQTKQAVGTTQLPRYPITEERPFQLPPCRNICDAAIKNCGWLYSWGSSTDYLKINCSDFPDSTDPEVCVGGQEANTPAVVGVCSKGYMECDNPQRCIHTTWKCDSYSDCEDKSDEKDCSYCQATKYKCSGGACVDEVARCNGTGECSMDSDEKHCVNLAPANTSAPRVNGQGVLQVYSSANASFIDACATGWDANATAMACKQMGFRSINATYVEVDATGDIGPKLKKSDLSGKYLHANLDLKATCPSNKTVQLTCGEAECGTRPAYVPSFARIVGGTEVRPGSWPWLVGLYGGERGAFYCAGVMINELWVLTAAHCIGGMTPLDDLNIHFGATRRFAFSKYKQVRKAVQMTRHPNHTMPDPPYDVGLIKVNESVVFNDYVRPICLPPHGKDMKPGMSGYVTGWGKTSETASGYSDVAKQVLVTLADTIECSATLINVAAYFKGMVQKGKSICAVGEIGYDACQGDSGGPLAFEEKGKWYVGGIVSTGVGCARGYPAVYTSVPYYVNWIHSVIGT